MSSSNKFKQALRADVGDTVYRRGEEYHSLGRVVHWKLVSSIRARRIQISGAVQGTRVYQTTVVYDTTAEAYIDLSCSCPYEYNCKHAVALALAYASVRDSPADAHRTSSGELGARPMQTVQQATDTRHLPEVVSDTEVRNAGTSTFLHRLTPHRTPFVTSQYAVLLHRDNYYAPSLHRKNQYYQPCDIPALLQSSELTETQRILLSYINEHNGFSYSSRISQSDPALLFPMLANEDIMVVCGSAYYDQRQVTVDVTPDPIRTEFVHERVAHPGYPDAVRHKVNLKLPDEREPHRLVGRSHWQSFGGSVVHETDAHVRLHTLNSAWALLVGRVAPLYEPGVSGALAYRYHGTTLTQPEMQQLASMVAQAPAGVSVTVTDELQHIEVRVSKPRRTLVIDLSTTNQSVVVSPVADYGVWKSHIAERIAHRHGGVPYVRRSGFEYEGNYIITEHDTKVYCVVFDDTEEFAFYKEIESHAARLGFTKTLRCVHRGKTALTRYLEEIWPALHTFAREHGYQIIFLHDTLPTEQVMFRTDFVTQVDAERDWLQFDVGLYCGDERITLDLLDAYMQSGTPYFRKADGTLVEVGNPIELERLARLLQNFRVRKKGGFEGALYHAPELSYVVTQSPHYSAAQNKGLGALMKRIESGKPIKPVRLPKKIREILRPYQQAGVAWLYFLRSYRFAGILADDMGLGKTLQALTVLWLERLPGVPSLVLCPKSLLYNWKNEAATFFPKMNVLVYDGPPKDREQMRATFRQYDLVVSGYNTFKQDAHHLCARSMRYNYAVLDEAQYIKNHATKLAQVVKKIPADYRLALTGTPIENHVFEMWSMYDYLMPGLLGKHDHFAQHFHKPIMEGGDMYALAHLRKKVEHFMLRRTKGEVLKELPPKIEQVRECTLTDAQNILYQAVLADVRGAVYGAVEGRGFSGAQIHILAGLTKLRQACNHPALLTKDVDYSAYESTKLDACMELIDEVAQAQRKVLVFSQFTGMLDILADALTRRGVGYTYLSGKTRKRQEVIDTFNTDPQRTAFLISMKAGGTGLNLTVADTVIIFDPWWNPSVENQAVDRAHRIGQTRSVNVYRLLTKGTIEERIQSLKNTKQTLFNAVVEESGALFEKLTWDDIRALFAE